jgi:hypothetical protein
MKIMTAKFKSKCYACDAQINAGVTIEYGGPITGSKHVDCAVAVKMQTVADKRASRSITQLGDFTDVYALFEKAAKGGKWPRITINADGYDFYLYVSGAEAMIPNVINVKAHDGMGTDAKSWYGRITMEGAWDQRHKEVDERMADALSRLAMDPVGTVAMYGRLSGKCCFCKKQLTDAPSVDAGYGPVCAKRWGLAWGGKSDPIVTAVQVKALAKEVLHASAAELGAEVWGMTADGKYGPVQNGSEYVGPSQGPVFNADTECQYCGDTGKVANTEPGADDVVCMGCVDGPAPFDPPQWNPDAAPIATFGALADLIEADAAAPKETVTLKTKEIIAEVNIDHDPALLDL